MRTQITDSNAKLSPKYWRQKNRCICISYEYIIAGIFFVLPCIETYQKVDLRTITLGVPPQEVAMLIVTDRDDNQNGWYLQEVKDGHNDGVMGGVTKSECTIMFAHLADRWAGATTMIWKSLWGKLHGNIVRMSFWIFLRHMYSATEMSQNFVWCFKCFLICKLFLIMEQSVSEIT